MTAYLTPGPTTASGNSSQSSTINTTSSGATNSNTIANTSGSGQAAGSTVNTYQPWQTSLQATAGQAAGNFLQTGNLPGTFGAPPVVTRAYVDNWKQNVAPQLAAQYGAGSPALGSSLALGLEQLDASVYQNQSNNFQGALSTAGNLGFAAVGNQTASNQSQKQLANTDTTSAFWQNQDQTINAANAASNLNAASPAY